MAALTIQYPDQLPGLAYTVKWSPVFFVQSQKTQSGASVDIALASTPLHQFELTYSFLRDYVSPSEIKRLMGFFLSMGGTTGRFLFSNPDDAIVTGQLIATSDGTTDTWTMVRTYGVSGASGTEPVGQVFAPSGASVTVYFNGVAKVYGTDYLIDTSVPGNNKLDLMTVPAAGVVITADFAYYYVCKFQDPTLTFEKFVNQIWSCQSVKLESYRPGA